MEVEVEVEVESGKWTAEDRSRLTDPVGVLAGMATVLIPSESRDLGGSREYTSRAEDSWKEKVDNQRKK